jgi:hypothetical protein
VRSSRTATIALLLASCGGEETLLAPAPPAGCKPGEWVRDDGACVPAGLPPDLACPPGEDEVDGACVAAGTPPEGCGAGFVHDGDRGCEPILPAAPCGDGEMAVPGDEACHEVAPCGSGTWGSIPIEPNTEHVDPSFVGTSTGSPAAPWTTIQEAVEDAARGAIVAVAAGDYAETVTLDKPVRLWGRCPSLVRVVGQTNAAVVVSGTSDVEVRGLGLTGAGYGVRVSDATAVTLDSLHVFDTADYGVMVDDYLGPAAATVRASLVERAGRFGVAVVGSEAAIDGVEVRATAQNAEGPPAGVFVDSGTVGSNVSVTGSHVDLGSWFGIFVQGSEAAIERVVVRDVAAGVGFASGIHVQMPCTPAGCNEALRPNATVRSSIVERSGTVALAALAADVLVEHVRARDPAASGFSVGIAVGTVCIPGAGTEYVCHPVRSNATLRASVVERGVLGVQVFGSDATVERVAVRDCGFDPALNGVGLSVGVPCRAVGDAEQCHAPARSVVTVRGSLVERSHVVGMFVNGSDAVVERTLVRDMRAGVGGLWGRGIQIQDACGFGSCVGLAPATAVVRSSRIDGTFEGGVLAVSSTLTIETSLVRATAAAQNGLFGDGVLVMKSGGDASGTVFGSRVEQSARAALATFGSPVAVGGNAFVCQAFDLDREPAADGANGSFDDLGGNGCGCPAPDRTCRAVSSSLAPPPAF